MELFAPSIHRCWIVFLCIHCLVTAGCAEGTCEASGDGTCSNDAENENNLLEKAFNLLQSDDKTGAMRLFENVLHLNPKRVEALIQLGLNGFVVQNEEAQLVGTERLMRAFDADAVPQPLSPHSPQGQYLATMMGRRFAQRKEYEEAKKYFKMAAFSQSAKGHCQLAQFASMTSPYPKSVKQAAKMMKDYEKHMQLFLDIPEIEPMQNEMDGDDKYIFCIMTAFEFSLFYEADARSVTSKHVKVATRLIPELQYTSPQLKGGYSRPLASRVRLGVVSAFFSWSSSVLEDFGGVLDRLPREKFEITFIFLNEKGFPSSILSTRYKNDASMTIDKNLGWLETARSKVEALQFDLLLYIDLTMSTMTQRLGMSRLAPVQSTSHGHPISSGIDKSVMNYFVSWAAAELPTAQDHYTEELALLPADTMHQYYKPRSKNGFSEVDGMPYENLTREDFKEDGIPADGHWYLCMQTPFKRHPVFDYMLADVLAADKEGRLILHDADTPINQRIIRKRLKKRNIDMTRVHFLPHGPHHRLLALYRLSDVILDSYYASGCTTTREALEVGAPVVTLPAKYLGSRWSLAYYTIIGVLDLVAKDAKDYVRLAVHMANDVSARSELQQRIRDNLHKMYYRTEAVDEWTKILLNMVSEDKAKSASASA